MPSATHYAARAAGQPCIERPDDLHPHDTDGRTVCLRYCPAGVDQDIGAWRQIINEDGLRTRVWTKSLLEVASATAVKAEAKSTRNLWKIVVS